MRLIPEFDLPAHTSSWGDGYPDIVVKCAGRPKKPEMYNKMVGK